MAHPRQLDSSRVTVTVPTKEDVKPVLDYLNNLALPVTSLHVEITVGGAGGFSPEDLAALEGVLGASHALVIKAKSISTAPPG